MILAVPARAMALTHGRHQETAQVHKALDGTVLAQIQNLQEMIQKGLVLVFVAQEPLQKVLRWALEVYLLRLCWHSSGKSNLRQASAGCNVHRFHSKHCRAQAVANA